MTNEDPKQVGDTIVARRALLNELEDLESKMRSMRMFTRNDKYKELPELHKVMRREQYGLMYKYASILHDRINLLTKSISYSEME